MLLTDKRIEIIQETVGYLVFITLIALGACGMWTFQSIYTWWYGMCF